MGTSDHDRKEQKSSEDETSENNFRCHNYCETEGRCGCDPTNVKNRQPYALASMGIIDTHPAQHNPVATVPEEEIPNDPMYVNYTPRLEDLFALRGSVTEASVALAYRLARNAQRVRPEIGLLVAFEDTLMAPTDYGFTGPLAEQPKVGWLGRWHLVQSKGRHFMLIKPFSSDQVDDTAFQNLTGVSTYSMMCTLARYERDGIAPPRINYGVRMRSPLEISNEEAYYFLSRSKAFEVRVHNPSPIIESQAVN